MVPPLSDQQHEFPWHLTANGVYSAASAYMLKWNSHIYSMPRLCGQVGRRPSRNTLRGLLYVTGARWLNTWEYVVYARDQFVETIRSMGPPLAIDGRNLSKNLEMCVNKQQV